MRQSALVVLAWCAALWLHQWQGGSVEIALMFGVLGFALTGIVVLAEEGDRRLLLLAAVVGPLLGWAIGSGTVVALHASDARIRLLLRVFLACAPIAALAFTRPRSLAAVALCGFSALTAVHAGRDRVAARVDTIRGVDRQEGVWVARLGDLSLEVDPQRIVVEKETRGRAVYLTASHVLLEWKSESSVAPSIGSAKNIRGGGFSLLAIPIAEALLIALLVATRVGLWRSVGVALLVPLLSCGAPLVLSLCGHEVTGVVLDKGSDVARSGRSGTRRYWYAYAIRARSLGGAPLADTTDELGFHNVAPGDRVPFVVFGNLQALSAPHVSAARLLVFALLGVVGVALARPTRR